MIDLEEIKSEILRLENSKMTYQVLEKLSVLYSVMNQQDTDRKRIIPEYSFTSAPESEFMEVMQTAPISLALQVIDEHLEAVKALYPKEYNSVIKKIKALE